MEFLPKKFVDSIQSIIVFDTAFICNECIFKAPLDLRFRNQLLWKKDFVTRFRKKYKPIEQSPRKIKPMSEIFFLSLLHRILYFFLLLICLLLFLAFQQRLYLVRPRPPQAPHRDIIYPLSSISNLRTSNLIKSPPQDLNQEPLLQLFLFLLRLLRLPLRL